MRNKLIKVQDFISYFDYENFKGGIIPSPKCIKRLKIKVDTIRLAISYEPN